MQLNKCLCGMVEHLLGKCPGVVKLGLFFFHDPGTQLKIYIAFKHQHRVNKMIMGGGAVGSLLVDTLVTVF